MIDDLMTRSVYGDTGWYLVVLGHHKLVLLGTSRHRFSIGLLCLYMFEKVENWSGVTDVLLTHRQTDRQQNIEQV